MVWTRVVIEMVCSIRLQVYFEGRAGSITGDWMRGMCLAYAAGKMELLFAELGETAGRIGWRTLRKLGFSQVRC
jgi:hypothetical protein